MHQKLIWMEVHIYIVKAKSQEGNIWVKHNDNAKRPKLNENQLGILGISSREFTHSVGNSAEGFRSGREPCWGYISIFENTPKSCRVSPVKVAVTLLSGSGKGAVGA